MARIWARVSAAALGTVLGLSLVTNLVGSLGANADVNYGGSSVTDLRNQLDTLEEEQRELATQKAIAEEKLAAAEGQLATTQAQINDQRERLGELQDQITQIALQQYQDRGLNATAMLMSSITSDDLLGYMTVLQQVTDAANSLFTSLQIAQGTLSDLERSEQAAVDAITEERDRIIALDDEARAKVDEVSGLLSIMTMMAAGPANGSTGYNTVGVGLADPSEAVPNPSTELLPPMTSYVLTSPYGMRIHPFSGGWSFHDGYDMAAACGTAVFAPANGFVIDYYWAGGYGNRLVIDHGIIDKKHVVTSYNHMSGAVARPGDTVEQGDRVALVGSTGASTGCHLHYMIWFDGEIVDPTPYAGPPASIGH